MDPPELIRLVYVSTASRPLTRSELDDIARVSRLRNRRAGLTGFLIHQGGRFHGVLEGPQRSLFARMEVIMTDARHQQLAVVRENTVTERRFDNWSVGFLPESGGLDTDDMAVAFLRTLSSRL